MQPITLVHISDLHLSEHLLRDPDARFKLPHRYGHDVQAFLALDSYLRNSSWDVLIITGDVSRIGNAESFEWMRNWLENEIVFGDVRVGLNLSKSSDQHYVIIPGNHDRFNGGLTQGSLDRYHHEFQPIRSGEMVTKTIRGQTVNFHLFDSTVQKGGFAYGEIADKALVTKRMTDAEIDVALLHHHFLQPPKHQRELATELRNSATVAAYMLNSGFDCICFGHTHKGYIGMPSVEILSGLLNDRRARGRFWRRLVPRFVLAAQDGECLVSYRRESAQDGKLPTLEKYFDYLYLRQKGFEVRGPREFASIKAFYAQMNGIETQKRMRDELIRARQRRVLISLAPSACQAEARWKGFHTLVFDRAATPAIPVAWRRHEFDGASFVELAADMHQS